MWQSTIIVVLITCWTSPSVSEVVKLFAASWLTSDDYEDGHSGWTHWDMAASYAIPLAVKHFNERNGILVPAFASLPPSCTSQIQLVDGHVFDSRGNPSTGVVNLIPTLGHFDVALGDVTSACTTPIAMVCGALQVPMISGQASTTELSDKSNYPTFMRTGPSSATKAPPIAKAMNQMGFQRLGMLYVEDALGSAWKNSFFLEWDRLGYSLYSQAYSSSSDDSVVQASMDSALNYLKSYKLNVILAVITHRGQLINMARSAIKLNMTYRHGKQWMFPDIALMSSQDAGEDYAAVVELMTGGLAFSVALPDDYSRNAELRRFYEYNVTSENLGGFFPNYSSLDPASPLYVSAPVPDPWLSSIDDYADTANTFDAVAAIGMASCMNSSMPLLERMLQSNFEGVTGTIKFDQYGDRDINTMSFQMLNFQQGDTGLTSVRVGLWSPGSVEWPTLAAIVFGSTGSSTPPNDVEVPYHEHNYLPPWARAIGYFFVAAVLTLVVGCSGWMFKNRSHPIVVNAQPVFLHMILVGVAFIGVSIVPLTMDDVDGSAPPGICMAFPWFVGLGMSFVVVSLVVKSHRISLIFNNDKMKKLKHNRSNRFVGWVFVVIAVEMAILIAWTYLSPLQFSREVLFSDAYGNPTNSVGACGNSDTTGVILLALLLTLHMLEILGLVFISNLIRKVPAKFQETQWIFTGSVLISQVYMLGLPTTIAVYKDPLGRFLVLSSVVFLTAVAVLAAMFYPKIMMFAYGEDYFQTITNTAVLDSPLRADRNKYLSAGDKGNKATVGDESMLSASKKSALVVSADAFA